MELTIRNQTTNNSKHCPRCKMSVSAEAAFCPHCGAATGPHKQVVWWHLHRRLYDWTMAWAYSPSSGIALAAISFTESIIFPVPPDVLLIPLVLGKPTQWRRTALNCTISSVLGAVTAFLIGWLAWPMIGQFIYDWFAWAGLTEENFLRATPYIEQGNFWIVFSAGFTPLPFKVFNIVAGTFYASPDIANPWSYCLLFFLAAAASRGARFFLVAGLMRIFGPKITPFVDKYFNWLALLFAALLVGGFVVVKYIA